MISLDSALLAPPLENPRFYHDSTLPKPRSTSRIHMIRHKGTPYVIKEFTLFSTLAQHYYHARGYLPEARNADERFHSEVRALQQLDGTGLAPAFYGSLPNRVLMEYVDAVNARHLIPDPTQRDNVTEEAIQMLAFLHHHGVIHGDPHIKNFLYSPERSVWVDFEQSPNLPVDTFGRADDLTKLLRSLYYLTKDRAFVEHHTQRVHTSTGLPLSLDVIIR